MWQTASNIVMRERVGLIWRPLRPRVPRPTMVNIMDLITSQEQTMSSREIANLTGKRHDNVVVVIKSLITDKILTPKVKESKFKSRGKEFACFDLDRRDSLVLVARLSPEFTAAVVDRWQELESKEQFQVPQTLPEALQLAADLALKIEQDKPKIEVYELLADRKGDVSTTILAKQLGTTAIKLNRWLRDKGIKWQQADLPKAGYQDCFNVISDVKNGHEFTQCLVTPHGQIKISEKWAKDNQE